MNNLISLILLIVGLVLISWGVSTGESFSSDISRLFTGSPTNKTYFLMIGGLVVTIIGIFRLFRGSNKVIN